MQASGGAIQSLAAIPFPQRLLNAVLSYGLYLSKIVVPWKLAFFYPHPSTISLVDVALPGSWLIGVTAVAVVAVRRLPFLFVGWCWFLGTLVPLIGLVQIGRQQMADRYAYFPAIGLYVAAAWSVPVLFDRIGLRRFPAVFGDGRRGSLRGVGICSSRLLAGQRHAVSSWPGCRRGEFDDPRLLRNGSHRGGPRRRGT